MPTYATDTHVAEVEQRRAEVLGRHDLTTPMQASAILVPYITELEKCRENPCIPGLIRDFLQATEPAVYVPGSYDIDHDRDVLLSAFSMSGDEYRRLVQEGVLSELEFAWTRTLPLLDRNLVIDGFAQALDRAALHVLREVFRRNRRHPDVMMHRDRTLLTAATLSGEKMWSPLDVSTYTTYLPEPYMVPVLADHEQRSREAMRAAAEAGFCDMSELSLRTHITNCLSAYSSSAYEVERAVRVERVSFEMDHRLIIRDALLSRGVPGVIANAVIGALRESGGSTVTDAEADSIAGGWHASTDMPVALRAALMGLDECVIGHC